LKLSLKLALARHCRAMIGGLCAGSLGVVQ
jgi:hypothetical protein